MLLIKYVSLVYIKAFWCFYFKQKDIFIHILCYLVVFLLSFVSLMSNFI